MKDHPILFSTAMVKAILDGNKTMTRRIIKNQDLTGAPRGGFNAYSYQDEETLKDKIGFESDDDSWVSPYGAPGDLLWVRETWRKSSPIEKDQVYYRAGTSGATDMKWKPSIFMPKKFCRIWLKNKDIRVERLQDISEEDAIKEGCEIGHGIDDSSPFFAKDAFETLWDSINGHPRKDGKDISWSANPWVWVVDFERVVNK